jgi:hypothetical protein
MIKNVCNIEKENLGVCKVRTQLKASKSPLNLNKSLLNVYKSLPNLHNSLLNLHKSPLNLHKSPLIFHKFLLSLFLLFLIAGCEKVIDVDLNDAAPALVIEGNLYFNNEMLEVRISRTGSYFDSKPLEKVNHAQVILENESGVRRLVSNRGEGIYRLENFKAQLEKNYRLLVETEDGEYEAVSTLHRPVVIDSLAYEYSGEALFFEGGYRILLYFSDPPEKKNYYRVKVYKNGVQFNNAGDIIVFDDSSLDGKGIQVRLRGQIFAAGDTARIELFSIDRNAWEYFTTLRDMTNANPGSPAPANPLSNFSNGALGYFSASSSDSKEIIIEN